MLGLLFHLLILAYITKKIGRYNHKWLLFYTILMYTMLLFVWNGLMIGEIECETWETYIYKNYWYSLLILYLIIFYIIFEGIRSKYFVVEEQEPLWEKLLQRLMIFICSIWKKGLKISYNDFLKKKWYICQINHNEKYKDPFFYFLDFVSVILITIRIIFYILFMYISIYHIHTWFSIPIWYIEKHLLNIIKNYIYILFIYNIIFSFFFEKINLYWIFFFSQMEFKSSFFDIYTLHSDTQVYLDRIHLHEKLFRRSGVRVALNSKGIKITKTWKKDINTKILFTGHGLGRFLLQKDWTKINYKIIDPFTNTIYFKVWVYYNRKHVYFVHGLEYWDYLDDKKNKKNKRLAYGGYLCNTWRGSLYERRHYDLNERDYYEYKIAYVYRDKNYDSDESIYGRNTEPSTTIKKFKFK